MFFLVVLVVASLAHAKNKKKQVLPDYVLKAETVLVVLHPDAGEPLTNPKSAPRKPPLIDELFRFLHRARKTWR
jgi:hypothetical protein